MDIENKMRNFISDILNPFSDRMSVLNKEMKTCKKQQEHNFSTMVVIKEKIDAEAKLRDQVSNLNKNVLELVRS